MIHPSNNQFRAERENMVAFQLRARGIRDERVLTAMEAVPRHLFVPEQFQSRAYEDHPIPIGMDQTISQPYIVAVMLQALALTPSDRVLEVGTGSSYVTALLCELVDSVYSVERHPTLLDQAQQRLEDLECKNAILLVADGTRGLPQFAPFDAILVSAAAISLPIALFDQLREGGRLIAPIGPPEAQELKLITKRNGTQVISRLDPCRFVPLISEPEFEGQN
ncbi:MAG TPA: protein-L-isoaspartate(D-aspartate) O-methyltransferase [Terriglobales bacterium]|jgi:protein-L-isoaspartate(D-aspartate) O-methyltransferase|nr:protein-L-isoaspartate(D-aspartate) O-methyltransferase [Terriglobales bacterium]